MNLHTTKIIAAFVLLLTTQWLLQGWSLVVSLLFLGALMAFFFKEEKNYLLKIILIQLGISLLFIVVVLSFKTGFADLMANSTLPSAVWIAAVLLVNLLTVFFCISIPFYFVRMTAMPKS